MQHSLDHQNARDENHKEWLLFYPPVVCRAWLVSLVLVIAYLLKIDAVRCPLICMQTASGTPAARIMVNADLLKS